MADMAAKRFPFQRTLAAPPAEYDGFRGDDSLSIVELWNGSKTWVATRYDDVRAILSDNRFSANPIKGDYPLISPSRSALLKGELLPFLRMDPPDHTRMRRMLTREFAHHRIQALRPLIESTVESLIDDMIERGSPADFFESLALPMPSVVIAKMLGIPDADHAFFQEATTRKMDLDEDPEVALQAGRELKAFMLDLLTKKAVDPAGHDDILSRLIVEQVEPGNLTMPEAVSMVEFLLMAGHETTANMTTLGLLSLLQNKPIYRRLAHDGDPAFVRGVVEELLRYHSIVQFSGGRVALEDVEVGGVTIRAGEGVLALLNAANRDPAKFENPDVIDFGRATMPPHVAFSFGVHQCLGQPLARLEMEVVFATLPKRLPDLALAASVDDLRFKGSALVLGLEALPIRW